MTDRELMQQAFERMTGVPDAWNNPALMQSRNGFIQGWEAARLAQPEQCQCLECRVTPHASDCAVHNEPAYPKGECTCKAQPEQEPVAWHEPGACGNVTVYEKWAKENGWLPLYAAPQRREWVGLTEEEQTQVAWSCGAMSADWLEFAKAIEAKLREKNA